MKLLSVPERYEDVESLFARRSPGEHAIIVERVIKCNHPQLGNNNREKLQTFFTFLLQYLQDVAANIDRDSIGDFAIVEKLSPFLYELTQFSPQASAKALLSVLSEKYDEYCKNPKQPPPLESVSWSHLVFREVNYSWIFSLV